MMMNSNYFPHSQLSHSHPPPPPLFIFPYSSRTINYATRKNRASMAMALLQQQENQKDTNFSKRRVILLMGFAVIPFLNTRAEAETLKEAENAELRTQDQKTKAEPGNSSRNPFFSLVNALGFLGSGVLAALYASAMKDKATSDATIESIDIKLKEKEATLTSLEKKYESELLNEKEVRSKALAKADQERQTLVNKLKDGNDMITSLGGELQKEKRLVQELAFQVDSLELNLDKAGDEKTELQDQLKEKLNSEAVLQERVKLLSAELKDKEDTFHNLKSKYSEKETEVNQLSSVYQQCQDQIDGLSSEIEHLKDVILKNEKELELKNAKVHNLNEELSSFISERDEYSKKLDATLREYDHFKSLTEKKMVLDSKLLREREEKIQQLEEHLKFAVDDLEKNKESVTDLTQEKENLRELLNMELRNVKTLERELNIVQGDLEKSRDEASDLGKQLQQSRNLCSELEAEVSKVQSEFIETRESLQRIIDDAKEGEKVLTGELISVKELLKQSSDKMQIMSQELDAAVQKSDGLEKELVDACEKAESASHELEEEKKIITSLNEELKALENQISNDKETRKSLESDLEESTKSLVEMNRNALMLSRDLELANSQISSLEYEKDALYKAVDEQIRVSQEARENLEDAHNLVMRLGKERESLENRGKKLEEEMASAKGEILRLRSQINSSKTKVTDQHQQDTEAGDKPSVSKKKVSRKRKVNPRQEDS